MPAPATPPALLPLMTALVALAALLSPAPASAVSAPAPSSTSSPRATTGTDGTSGPDGAVATAPVDTPAPQDAPDGVSVEITDVAPDALTPDGEVRVRLRVTNGGDAPVEGLTAELRLRSSRLSTRSEVAAWADAEEGDAAGGVLRGVPLEPLAAGTTRELELAFPASGLDLDRDASAWGPRGVAVDVVDASGARLALDRSFVVWYPGGAGATGAGRGFAEATQVSVAVPLVPGAPAVRTGYVPDEQMTALTSQGGHLAAALQVAEQPGVTWVLDPQVLASSQPAGTGAPGVPPPGLPAGGDAEAGQSPQVDDAQDDDAQHDDAPDDDAQVDAGAGSGADGATGSGDQVAEDPVAGLGAVPPSPSATTLAWRERLLAGAVTHEVVLLPLGDTDARSVADAGTEELWADAERLALSTVDVADLAPAALLEDVAWPAGGVLDVDTARMLAGQGVDATLLAADAQPDDAGADLTPDATTRVVLGDGTHESTDESTHESTDESTDDGTDASGPDALTGLLADEALSSALAAGGRGGPAGEQAVQRLLAETAAITLERPSDARHVLVAAPRDWPADPAAAAAAVRALLDAPWVDPAALGDLLAAPEDAQDEPRVDLLSDPASPADALLDPTVLRTAAGSARLLQAMAPALRDLTPVEAVTRRAVAAASSGWRADREVWARRVARLADAAAAVPAAVTVLQGGSVNVVGAEVSLPVTVQNDLGQDVRVRVRATSSSPRLRVDDAPLATVAAQSRTQVRIPVSAVANGDITLDLQLLTPDGTPISDPLEVPVRVRVEWEAWGTAGVIGLGALVLLAGLVRSVHRLRRRPRNHSADAGAPGAGSTEETS